MISQPYTSFFAVSKNNCSICSLRNLVSTWVNNIFMEIVSLEYHHYYTNKALYNVKKLDKLEGGSIKKAIGGSCYKIILII